MGSIGLAFKMYRNLIFLLVFVLHVVFCDPKPSANGEASAWRGYRRHYSYGPSYYSPGFYGHGYHGHGFGYHRYHHHYGWGSRWDYPTVWITTKKPNNTTTMMTTTTTT